MSANVIDSLFVALGFQVEDEGLELFKGRIAEVGKVALIAGAAMATAVAGVGLFVSKIAEGIDDLGDWAERENFGIEATQELGHAAEVSGSSMEALKNSVSGMNKVLGEAALGIGRGKMAFEKLGMSAKDSSGEVKSVDALLEEVADKMQDMSRPEQIAMAEKLGIDRSLIPLLEKGSVEIAKLREEARAFGVVTEKDAELAGDLVDALTRTKAMVRGLSNAIAIALMPSIKGVVDGIRGWLLENAKLIKSGILETMDVFGTIISRVWYWLRQAVDAGVRAVKWVAQFDGAIRVAALALAAFLAPFVTIPIVIGAAIAAIGLFLDDFEVWQNGGDSLIGELLKDFPKLEAWIIGLWAALNTFWDLIVMIIQGWIGLIDAIWNLDVVAAYVFREVIDWVGGVSDSVKSLIGWFVSAYDKLKEFGGAVADFFANNPIFKALSFSGNLSGGSQGGPLGSSPGGVLGKATDSMSSNSATSMTHNSVQVTAPITINSSDPERAGESVRKELNRVNKQATRNGESAVAL